MEIPNGRRSSDPMPLPSASGKPPSMAAMVVIRIGTKAQQASLIDGVDRRLPVLPLSLEREINHHDGVLLHDSDQQDDSDQRHHTEFGVEDHQEQNRSGAR